MKMLLVPIGSAGDVHPFFGIGHTLKERGHDVTLIANPYVEEYAKREGFDYLPLGENEYDWLVSNPDLWHPTKGLKIISQAIDRFVRPLYELLRENYVPGKTLVVASSLAFGARVAQDHLKLPLVTIHLQPNAFRSAYDPPMLSNVQIPRWFPAFMVRGIYWFLDRAVIDHSMAKEVRSLQKELGLPPVKRMFHRWIHSPNRTIGLFPDWYCQPQPDWPSQIRLTNFPLYDERKSVSLSDELSQFLSEGDAPIAFTPGSANVHAHDFFQAAVESCEQIGRRGILLTRHPEDQIPSPLPSTVRHFEYAPFSELLPRCAAMVHHGGIGTCAQAMLAGVPQLLMPMGFDQFDNANRIKNLGIGDSLPRKKFVATRVAPLLDSLLRSEEVAIQCREVQQKVKEKDGLAETGDLIEEVGRSS